MQGVLGVVLVWAQGITPVGKWGSYLSHDVVYEFAQVGDYVYGRTPSGLVRLGLREEAYKEYTIVEGLAELRPTAIAADRKRSVLYVGYPSGFLQKFTDGPKQILSDIATNPFYTDKSIHSLWVEGDTLYVATGFGVVSWDLLRDQALLTANRIGSLPFSSPVYRVWVYGGRLWVSMRQGFWSAPVGSDWRNPLLWQKEDSGQAPPDTLVSGITITSEGLWSLVRGELYRYQQGQWTKVPTDAPYDVIGGGGGYLGYVPRGSPHAFWISPMGKRDSTALYFGVAALWANENGDYAVGFLGGLAYVRSAFISKYYGDKRAVQGCCAITELLTDKDGFYYVPNGCNQALGNSYANGIGYFSFSEGRSRWVDLPRSSLPPVFSGYTSMARKGDLVYIGSCWNGMASFRLPTFEVQDTFYRGGVLGSSSLYPDIIGVTAIRVDGAGNVWVGQQFTSRSFHVYTTSGRWYSWTPPIAGPIRQILIDRRGYKWLVIPGRGLCVFDDGGSPEQPTRHRWRVLSSNPSAGALPSDAVYCVAEDREGFIWVGTSKGIAVFYEDPFQVPVAAVKPVIESRYLLEEEVVWSILADGQNQKWMGTQQGGVYVVSPDGTRQLVNYNTANAPLPSNWVFGLHQHPETGEIYVLTTLGMVGYRAFNTPPQEKNDTLFIFPNPVLRSWDGWIAIRGLAEGSTVRIATPTGEAVRILAAEGGQAVWDGRNLQGLKVPPGVYLAIAIDENTATTAVGKIVIIE
ncbi:MAG: two-component regulator propeller domain-containing protein [Bacteroidia bacterium]